MRLHFPSFPQHYFLLGAVLFSTAALLAGHAAAQAAKPPAPVRPRTVAKQDPGELKFQQNCNRCHNAPESLSPRIVGTVVRHMRVRATLNAQDERDILHFLRP